MLIRAMITNARIFTFASKRNSTNLRELAPRKSHISWMQEWERLLALAAMLLVFAILAWDGSAMAVSEQSIGATTTRRPVATTPPVREHPAMPAAAQEAPLPQASAPQAPTADAASPPVAPPNPLKAFQAHTTFPYTIRPGDTLGAIAGLFGIPVADLARVNHLNEQSELEVGKMLRIPNPAIAHERELNAQIEQLQRDNDEATQRASKAESALGAARTNLQSVSDERNELDRDVRSLTWWKGTTYVLAGTSILMFGAMLLALIDWWMLRSRFRAVVELNESLRRIDYKYKTALAKAELRLQELYGRRRRGIHEGQERPKLAEEAEIEALTRELKAVLEHHLKKIGPGGNGSQRAQWRERIARVSTASEPRALRR